MCYREFPLEESHLDMDISQCSTFFSFCLFLLPLHCFQLVVFHNLSKILIVFCGRVSLIPTTLSLPEPDLLPQRLSICYPVTEYKVKAGEVKIQQIVTKEQIKSSFIGKAGK